MGSRASCRTSASLVADPARGLVYGNRGCLHEAEGRIRRRFAGRRWIASRLSLRDRRRAPLMRPGRYTELFFLDEATALAAGYTEPRGRPAGTARLMTPPALLEWLRAEAEPLVPRPHPTATR